MIPIYLENGKAYLGHSIPTLLPQEGMSVPGHCTNTTCDLDLHATWFSVQRLLPAHLHDGTYTARVDGDEQG